MKLVYDDIIIKDKRIIRGGVFDIPENEITAVVGPNGCGKTSLLKKIFHDFNHKEDIVFVDQNNNAIITDQSVLYNISMTCDEEENQRIRKQVEKMGFGNLLEHKANKLSGGEKRLISLLRGILSPHKFLIIDEPTNDLDYEVVEVVLTLLQRIKETKTILIVSHDDRVLSISSAIYEIKEEKICLLSDFAKIKTGVAASKCQFAPEKRDEKFLRKLFGYNWVSFVLALTFILMISISMIDYKERIHQKTANIPENQINLYLPMSTAIDSPDRIYPVSLMGAINTLNPIVQINTLSTIDKLIKDSKGFFEWKIESTEEFTFYPLEYFDPIEKRTYFTMDYYLEKYCNSSSDTSAVNTEDFFEQPTITAYEINEVYPFDMETFQQCVADLEKKTTPTGEKLVLMSAAVVMKGEHHTSEFFSSEQLEAYSDKMIYVTSNEVIHFLKQIRLLRDLVNMGAKTLILMLAFGMVELLYMCLYLKTQKNKIFIVKNYGFTETETKESAIAKMNSKYPKWILMFAFLCFNIAYFSSSEAMQSNYIFSIFVAWFLSMTYTIDKRIIIKYIENDYRWYAR